MTRYMDEPSNERLSPDLRQSEMQAAPTGDSEIWSITHLLGQLLGAPLDRKYSPILYGTSAIYHLVDRKNRLALSSSHEY